MQPIGKKTFSQCLADSRGVMHRLAEKTDVALSRRLLGFGGSHTVVTYPPLCAFSEPVSRTIETIARDFRNEAHSELPEEIDLYLHIPFCEYHCDFCHYSTLVTSKPGAMGIGTILDRLTTSLKMWHGELSAEGVQPKVASIYIGGGTGFYPSEVYIRRLLEGVFSTLERSKVFSLCVEASASSLLNPDTESKLVMLKSFGLDRVSVGVQSVDMETLAVHGRMQISASEASRAIQRVVDVGVPSINVDLMQGIHGQAHDESIQSDLDWFLASGSTQLTLYIQRFHLGSPVFRAIQASAKPLEDVMDSAAIRLASDRYLLAHGMTAIPGGRYSRDGSTDSYKRSRGSQRARLLGIGPSAYSRLGRHAFQNTKKVAKWCDAIDQCSDGVECCLTVSDEETLQGEILSGIRKCLSGSRLREIFSDPLYNLQEFTSKRIDSLLSSGLIEWKGGSLCITEVGRVFEEEICWSLYSPSMSRTVDDYYSQMLVRSEVASTSA